VKAKSRIGVKAKTGRLDSHVLLPKAVILVARAAMVMVVHVAVPLVLEWVWSMATWTAASAVSMMEMWAVARGGTATLLTTKPGVV
jgi:hypothetical protein